MTGNWMKKVKHRHENCNHKENLKGSIGAQFLNIWRIQTAPIMATD